MFTRKLFSASRHIYYRQLSLSATIRTSEAATSSPPTNITIPPPSGTVRECSPKIEALFTEISKLNLIEVSELTTVLKQRLNLPDAPVMSMGAMMPQAGAQDEEEAAPTQVKSSFNVKLVKFDDTQKIALIKEIKGLIEGMNLVQAKKFVEGAPAVVKSDVSKDEAEKLKEAITKVGGVVEIE